MHEPINRYGDVARPTAGSHGMDIASQRADKRGALALGCIEPRVAHADGRRPVDAFDIGGGRGSPPWPPAPTA